MERSGVYRWGYTLAALGAALWLPWWCVVIMIVIGCMLFSWYIEAIGIGFVLDGLYGQTGVWSGLFTIGSVGICGLVWYVKERMRISA